MTTSAAAAAVVTIFQPLNSLLDLPPELRIDIYDHYLASEPSISDPLGVLRFGGGLPGLLLASQEVYWVAAPMAYKMRLHNIAQSVNGQRGVQRGQGQAQGNVQGGGQRVPQPYQTMGGVNGVLRALGVRR